MRKVYRATFNQYTNNDGRTIHNPIENKYVTTENGALIILDVNINKYMNYGDGFKTLEYLGFIPVVDIKTEDDTFINTLNDFIQVIKKEKINLDNIIEATDEKRQESLKLIKEYYIDKLNRCEFN